MALRDRFGNEIKPGSIVAYPGRAGSSCWIGTGRVTEIVEDKPASVPSWLTWSPRLRLTGGTGRHGKSLGARSIRHHDDVIVLAHVA